MINNLFKMEIDFSNDKKRYKSLYTLYKKLFSILQYAEKIYLKVILEGENSKKIVYTDLFFEIDGVENNFIIQRNEIKIDKFIKEFLKKSDVTEQGYIIKLDEYKFKELFKRIFTYFNQKLSKYSIQNKLAEILEPVPKKYKI
jgi:hypothetical protein